MSLLDDVRAAGLDVRLTEDGRLQIRGPADVQDRLRDAIRRQSSALTTALRYEQNQCCADGPAACDHVWCHTCADWANDTGIGPSCCPQENAARRARGGAP